MSDTSKPDVNKAPTHGRLYDNFTAQATHPHGGSYFDSGFGQQAHTNTHGRLHDLFGVHQETTGGHGERYDDFGWRDMPAIHGQLFDTDFRLDLPGDPHGTTWYDVFRGGRTQARYMFDGRDYEGTVIDCNPEYATVRSHDGQTHEVGLSQFLAYRTPNEHQAAPATPASDAEAPSAHNATAHGNHGTTPAHDISGELPPRVEHVSEGPGNPDARSEGVPEGLMDTFTRLKTAAEGMDVGKAASGRRSCELCGDHPATHTIHTRYTDKRSSLSLACKGCAKASAGWKGAHIRNVHAEPLERDSVLNKSVDTTATALRGDTSTTVATVGHRRNCPRGGSAPCGAERDGRCSLCRAEVHEHEAVGKTLDDLAEVAKAFGSVGDALAGGQTTTVNTEENPGSTGQAPLGGETGDLGTSVPERDHKSSDHHSDLKSKPGRCPHCGGALEQIDNATRQGQPSRAHKCVGHGLDVLKALA